MLDGAARLADDPADAERLARTRDLLFPEGTGVVILSYLGEAGEAERAEAHLAEKEVQQTLREIHVRKGVTLLDEVRAYVTAGRALGVVESRKAALEAATAAAPAPTTSRAATLAARNEWVQTLNLVLSTAKRLRGDHAARFAPVLREIERVQGKADARSARASDAEASNDDADADTTTTETPVETVAKTG